MPLVTCPGCKTTLNVNLANPGQPISCSVCKTLFQMPTAPVAPLATPVAAPAPQWQQEVPAEEEEAPVDRSAFALSGPVPDDEEPIDRTEFTMTRATSDVMHDVRLDTVIKETSDILLLAIGINVVAAFVTALAIGMASSSSRIAFLLGYGCLALWMGGLVVIGYGATCLRQRRRPDLVTLGAICAFLVGALESILAASSFLLLLIQQGAVSIFMVLLFLAVVTLTLATAAFTIYVGMRTFRTLQRPEVISALNTPVPAPRARRAPGSAALPPGQPPMPPA